MRKKKRLFGKPDEITPTPISCARAPSAVNYRTLIVVTAFR
jgi:hypothetical protein